MKIILVDPGYLLGSSQVALGILSTAATSRSAGWDVSICEYEGTASIDKKCEDVCRLVGISRADAVGITTRCDYYPFSLMIAKRVKTQFPNVYTILGGPQATHTDVDTLEACPYIDVIIRGEGEITTSELLRAIEKEQSFSMILGLTYRENGVIRRNPIRSLCKDISYELAWDLMPKKFERVLRERRTCSIESGRGCPNSCVFCCTCKMWSRTFRIRSAEKLYEEMQDLYHRYGVNYFQLEHDSFMGGKQFREFISKLGLLNTDGFKWSCSARIDNFDTSLLNEIESAGCDTLYFGIESASMKMQKLYNKHLNVIEAEQKLIYILKESKIKIIVSFICGHPLEQLDDITQTLEMTIRLSQYENCVNVQLHKLAPLNGSDLHRIYKDELEFNGFISDQAHSNQIEEFFIEEIKSNPKLFASFFDFKHIYISSEEISNICNIIHPICKTYPRTISAIRTIISVPLLELVNCFLNLDSEESFRQNIHMMFPNADLPTVVDDIFSFEYELSSIEPIHSNVSYPKDVCLCEMINPTLQRKELSFDPTVEITPETLHRAITSPSYKFRILMWAGEQSPCYKIENEIDKLLLSSSAAYSTLVSNNYLREYIKDMERSKLIICG